MIIHRFTQGDDLPNATAAFVEEDGAWWAGIQKCGAMLALASALAASASQAAVAKQVFSYHQDDPAGNLTATVDEYFWQNPVPPVAYYVPPQQIWVWDEQIPAGSLTATVDEYYWQNPVAPVAGTSLYPQPWTFDEQIPAGSLHGQFDEDFWINLVPPVSSYVVPVIFGYDDTIVPQPIVFIPEDFFWFNPVVSMAPFAPPVFFLFDDGASFPRPPGKFEDHIHMERAPSSEMGVSLFPGMGGAY